MHSLAYVEQYEYADSYYLLSFWYIPYLCPYLNICKQSVEMTGGTKDRF